MWGQTGVDPETHRRGRSVLATLRRASRRASFGVAVTFAPTEAGGLPRYRASQLGTEANSGR
jgi:hypothetical protein